MSGIFRTRAAASRPPERAKLALSGAARAWLVGLALLLIVPSAAMRLQGEDALRAFHNRVLAPWPEARLLRRDPAGWFAAANRWLADRVYPIESAAYLKNNLAWFVLHASPSANISVGSGGLVFLNGSSAEAENDFVDFTCRQPADPANRARLEAALGRIAAFGRSRGYPVDVLVPPTVPMLYGDRLPLSVPSDLRALCAAGPAGRPPMSLVQAPEGLRYLYPFSEVLALRDDPAMFPMGNYHADGLSVRTVTDAYLRAVGAAPSKVPLALTSGISEILGSRGVPARFPLYAAAASDAVSDEAAEAAITDALTPLYGALNPPVSVYRNPTAPNPEAVMMLSDSFGTNQGTDFADAFRTVIQVQAPRRDVASMLDATHRLMPFDRLVLVFNDNNLGRLSELGELLSVPADR